MGELCRKYQQRLTSAFENRSTLDLFLKNRGNENGDLFDCLINIHNYKLSEGDLMISKVECRHIWNFPLTFEFYLDVNKLVPLTLSISHNRHLIKDSVINELSDYFIKLFNSYIQTIK